MANDKKIEVILEMKNGQYISSVRQASNETQKFKNSVNESSGGLINSFKNLGNTVKGFLSLGVAAVITKIGKSSLTAAAEMEQQRVAFTTMLGSAEKAKSFLSDIQNFAASTPFQFNELVDASKKMLAMGFASDEVIDKLRMIGDVSAGLGQPLGDMAFLFSTIKAQGKAMTQDLNQFASRGVPVYSELAKIFGTNEAQIRKFAEQGKIGFKEIEQAFKNMTSEGGKFAGLMDAQSKTLAGRWSNLNDQIDRTLVALGNKLAPAAGDLITIASQLLEKFGAMNDGPDSITMTGSIIKDVKNVLNGTADTVEKIGDSLGPEKVEEILNEVRMWEATSTGVSAKVDDIMKKYGDVNAAAAIYSEYVKGHVELTDEQVINLESIIQKHQEMLASANAITQAYGKMNAAIQGFIKTNYGNKKDNNKPSNTPTDDKNRDQAQKYIESFRQIGMSEREIIDDNFNQDIKKINDLHSKKLISEEQYNQTREKINKKYQDSINAYNMQKTQQWLSFGAEALSGISNLYNMAANNRLAQLDEQYAAEVEAVKNSTLSEEEKENKLAILEADYQAKQKRIKLENAKIQKKIALTQALISIPTAVMKTFDTFGWPWGVIPAAIMGAIGAKQVQMIKDQPVALAQGGITQAATMAVIGEGSYNEAVLPLSAKTFRELGAGIEAARARNNGTSSQVIQHFDNRVTVQGSIIDKDGFSKAVYDANRSIERRSGVQVYSRR